MIVVALEDLIRDLTSPINRTIIDALNVLMTRPEHVTVAFPEVVKVIAKSPDVAVKRVAYVYVMEHCNFDKDLTLLAINTVQKDLQHSNAAIRALALRSLASMRIPSLFPLLVDAIEKCACDLSPYVRKCAALAIIRAVESTDLLPARDLLQSCILRLLADQSPFVVGAAVQVFEACYQEDRMDLLHSYYRRLCRLVATMDPQSQVSTISLLTRYVRLNFLKPSALELNADHQLLLDMSQPLLASRDSSVVVTVISLFRFCAPAPYLHMIPSSLVRLLRCRSEIRTCALQLVDELSRENPRLFDKYYAAFFVLQPRVSRREQILLLDILTHIISESNKEAILDELCDYLNDPRELLVIDSLFALEKISSKVESLREHLLACLLQLMAHDNEKIVSAVVIVMTSCLMNYSGSFPVSTVRRIIQQYPHTLHQSARYHIIWIARYRLEDIIDLSPDLLRLALKDFSNSNESLRRQIVLLACQLHESHLVLPAHRAVADQLFSFALDLAKYDE
eukprot:Partr_v1_DN28563_c1_g1_i1_m73069 putative Adaptor-related protein complex 3 beta